MDINQTSAIITFVSVVLAGAVLVGVGTIFLKWYNTHKTQILPNELSQFEYSVEAFLSALTPVIYQAVIAGEKMLVVSLQTLDNQILSADKKAVADSFYALIPPVVVVDGFPIPVGEIKKWVTPEIWEAKVKEYYDEADALISRNIDYLKKQVDALDPSQKG